MYRQGDNRMRSVVVCPRGRTAGFWLELHIICVFTFVIITLYSISWPIFDVLGVHGSMLPIFLRGFLTSTGANVSWPPFEWHKPAVDSAKVDWCTKYQIFICIYRVTRKLSISIYLWLLYPRPTKLEGGYTGFTLSVRPSVRLSVDDMVSGA